MYNLIQLCENLGYRKIQQQIFRKYLPYFLLSYFDILNRYFFALILRPQEFAIFLSFMIFQSKPFICFLFQWRTIFIVAINGSQYVTKEQCRNMIRNTTRLRRWFPSTLYHFQTTAQRLFQLSLLCVQKALMDFFFFNELIQLILKSSKLLTSSAT